MGMLRSSSQRLMHASRLQPCTTRRPAGQAHRPYAFRHTGHMRAGTHSQPVGQPGHMRAGTHGKPVGHTGHMRAGTHGQPVRHTCHMRAGTHGKPIRHTRHMHAGRQSRMHTAYAGRQAQHKMLAVRSAMHAICVQARHAPTYAVRLGESVIHTICRYACAIHASFDFLFLPRVIKQTG